MSRPISARRIARRPLLQVASTGLALTPIVVGGAASAAAGSARVSGGSLAHRNRRLVSRALHQFYGNGATRRFGELFDEDYVEHDPAVAGGRAGLVAWVEAQQAMRPRLVTTVKRMVAQGTMVAVHSHRSATPADEFTGTAVVDLFDLRDGRIIEHWAYTQPVPATSASGHSMFDDVYEYAGGRSRVSRARAEANRNLILKAWAAVLSARDFTVLDRYWAPGDGYLQHNPAVPNGVGGLQGFVGSLPPTVSQNRFSLGSEDLVVTINQSVVTSGDLDDDRTGTAVVDFYRIVDGRAVEHWDVVGPVPTSSANGTSVFSRLYPVG